MTKKQLAKQQIKDSFYQLLIVVTIVSLVLCLAYFVGIDPVAPKFIQRAATFEECQTMDAHGIHCLPGETPVYERFK